VEYCTCGAELPPDARFCHRCGKPQREEMVPELAQQRPPLALPPQEHRRPARLDFHNATAVRISLLIASLASLLSALPALAAGVLGLIVWWLLAGAMSAWLYRRRTGQFLTVNGGLRVGWITGLIGSAITAVLFTVSVAPLAHNGGIAALYQEQLRKMSVSDPNVQEALKILQSPSGLAAFLIVALLFFFAFITLLASAGGALGAKLGGKPSGGAGVVS
jgi:zinc-ribbon domain